MKKPKNQPKSDTPRTDSKRGFHGLDTAVDAEFSEQLERELNAANAKIKRLTEAFDAAEGLIAVNSCGCPYGDEVFHYSTCIQAINRYHKAKEENLDK